MRKAYILALAFCLYLQAAMAGTDRKLIAFEDSSCSLENRFFRTGTTIYFQALGTAQAPSPVLFVRLMGIEIQVGLAEVIPKSGIYRGVFHTGSITDDARDIVGTFDGALLELRSDIDRDGITGTTDVLNLTIDDQPPGPPRWCDSNATPRGSVRVNWTQYEAPDFRRYTVVRALRQDFADAIDMVNITSANILQWFDPENNLISGTPYWYGVCVVDLAGNPSSIRGAERTVMPFNDTTPPAKVTGLKAQAPEGGNSINLTWVSSPEPDVLGYSIYHSITAPVETVNRNLIGFVTGTTFLHEGISANYLHLYVVVAFDEEENPSPASTPANATPDDTLAPGPPTNLAISTDATGYLNLTWSPPEGEEVYRYRIYRSEESGAQQFWNPIVLTSETNFIDEAVVHGKTYFYVVRASDRAGNEEKNTLQVAATSVDTTPPRPPRGLKAEDTDIGARIRLVWLAPGGEVPAEYWVFRSNSHGAQNFSSPMAVVSKTEFTDRTVQDGVVYYYVVRAVDVAGNVETNTNEIAVVSRDITPPPAALEVIALPQRGGMIGVGWMPPGSDVEDVDLAKQIRADVDHYNVYWNTYEGFKPDPSKMFSTTETSIHHSNLVDGQTYYYIVRTVDAAGNENKQDDLTSVSAVADTSPPGAPTNLKTFRLEDGRIKLDWDAPSGEAPYRYNIYRSTAPRAQSYRYPFGMAFAETEWIDENVTDEQRYFYVVRSADFLLNEDPNTIEVGNYSEDLMPPPAPRGLEVTQLAMGDLMVNWSEPEYQSTSLRGTTREADKVVLYRVYVSELPGQQNFSRPVAETRQTFFVDKGLKDMVNYYYVVRSVDSAGNEDENRYEVRGTADASPPSAPVDAIAQRSPKGEVVLSWSDPDGEAVFEYRIYKFTGNQTQGFKSPLTATRKNLFVDNDVSEAIQYRYVIRSVDKAGNEGRNTDEILAPVLLGPPLKVEARASKNGAIDVTWEPPAGAKDSVREYHIYRSMVPGVEQLGDPWATTVLTMYKDTSRVIGGTIQYMVHGTRYYYSVRAVDMYGNEGMRSTEASAVSDNQPPDKPRELAAVAEPTGEITVKWLTPAGERVGSYRIYRSIKSGTFNFMVPLDETTRIIYYDKNVKTMTTYYYVVRSVDEAGNEEQNTDEVSVMAFDAPPQAPRNLRAQVRPNGSITLIWDQPLGEIISRYNVYRALESGKENFAEPFAMATVTTFTDGFVEHGLTYYYVVRAVDSTGNEEENKNEISKMSQDTEPPGQPADLKAAAAGSGTILLQWQDPTGERPAGYIVYRSQSPYFKPGNQNLLARTQGNSYLDQDPSLGDAQTYHYVVHSVDSIGNEDGNENRVQATTPPAAPANLSASSNERGEIVLVWKIPTTPTAKFRIYRSTKSKDYDLSNPLAEIPYPVTTYIDSGLNQSEVYYYIVRSVDARDAEDSNLKEVHAVSMETVPPLPTAGLRASQIVSGAVGLTWSHPDPEDVSLYNVYRCDGAPNLARARLLASTNQTSIEDVNVTSGRTYAYLVRAVDVHGNEEANANWTSTMSVDNLPPAPPTNLTAEAHSGGTIELNWNSPGERNLTFSIYRATTRDPANATLIASTNVTTFLDAKLINGKEYFYMVRARDSAGNEERNEAIVSAVASKAGPRVLLALLLIAVFVSGAYVVDRRLRASEAHMGKRG